MTIPKIYVVDRTALAVWGAPNSFTLTFDEAAKFVHDLQDAMIDQTNLSNQANLEFFILVNPKKEGE